MVEFPRDDLVALLRLVLDGDVERVLHHVHPSVVVAEGTVPAAPDHLAHAAVAIGDRERFAVEGVFLASQRARERFLEQRLPLWALGERVEDVLPDQFVPGAPGDGEIMRVHFDEPEVRVEDHERGGKCVEEASEIHAGSAR